MKQKSRRLIMKKYRIKTLVFAMVCPLVFAIGIANSQGLKVAHTKTLLTIENDSEKDWPRRLMLNCEEGGFFSARKCPYIYITTLKKGTNTIPFSNFYAPKDGLRFNPNTHEVVSIWILDDEYEHSAGKVFK